MKTFITTVLISIWCLASYSVFSQITITLDDLEYENGEYYNAYGRTSLYIVQGLTGKIGGPHTWDFSTGPTDINYTFDYVLPSTTPCSGNYPLATITEKRTGDGSPDPLTRFTGERRPRLRPFNLARRVSTSRGPR